MKRADEPTERARLARVVHGGRVPIVAACAVIGVLAIPAITTIEINDNPVRWFRSDHEVRVASEELNELLPGTFGANVILTADVPGALDDPSTTAAVADFATALETHPEVGAVQTYLDSDLPVLRNGDQANVRLQLRSGDNTVMSSVIDTADAHLAAAPFDGVSLEWAGESYLNLRWQEKMVSGMMTGFISTIVVVFVLLIILFRSPRWALLAILPVLWTVLVVYGALGLIGRDFDMPVAVLSTLVIGIGVDFAIHFAERYRALRVEHGSTSRALEVFFGEPARALSRNAAVIAIGFTPLFLSSLVPYVVVGAFLASILVLSWLSTVLVLPAIVSLGRDSGATAPSRR